MKKKLVLTHDNCVDGCCSQLIFKEILGDSAIYVPVDHSDYNPKFKEKYDIFKKKVEGFKDTDVYMADICLPADWIEHFLAQNNKVIILDHHNTAIPYVEEFEKRIENGENLNMEIVFSKDNTESGAMLTWKYLNPNKPIPDVVKYVCDGDRWEFKYKETQPFYSKINEKLPNDNLELLNDLIFNKTPNLLNDVVNEGKVIREIYMKEVESYLPYAKPVTLFGRNGSIVEAPGEYKSELGNMMARKFGGFALIVDSDNNVVKCSLRSIAPEIVSDIAKKLGGGGHEQASAFRLNSFDELNSLLKEHGNNVELFNSTNKVSKNKLK